LQILKSIMNFYASAISGVYGTLTGRTGLQRNHQDANIWRIHTLLLFMPLAMVKKRRNYSLSSVLPCILVTSSLLIYYIHFPSQSKSRPLAKTAPLWLGSLNVHKNCLMFCCIFSRLFNLDCYHVCTDLLLSRPNRNGTLQWVVFDSLKIWLSRKRLGLGNYASCQGLKSFKIGMIQPCLGLQSLKYRTSRSHLECRRFQCRLVLVT